MYLGGIGPGDFLGVFDIAITFFKAVSTLTLLGPSLRKNKQNKMGKVFTQPRSEKGFHLASSAPSIWSWLGGKAIGFVVVHRLRDLP